MKNYHLTIIGSAMTGASLAIYIRALTTSYSIAIIDAKPPASEPAADETTHRSVALSYGSVELLKKIGIWKDAAPYATAIQQIQVSECGHAGRVDLTADALSLDSLGYVISLDQLEFFCRQKLQQLPHVDYIPAAPIKAIRQHQQHVQVSLDHDHEDFTTSLLVAADGTHSTCAQLLNLHPTEHDFCQRAIVANVVTEQAHQHCAFERFTSTGPLALLPFKFINPPSHSGSRQALVWCMSPQQHAEIAPLADEAFLAALQQKFGWQLGRFLSVGPRYTYPLTMRYQPRPISHRVVFLGNAAQTLHPITGQGFNLALRDVQSLAELLAQAASSDIGDYHLLCEHLKRRQADRNALIMATSTLVHTFANNWWPLKIARQKGLFLCDNLPSIKAQVLKHTLGF